MVFKDCQNKFGWMLIQKLIHILSKLFKTFVKFALFGVLLFIILKVVINLVDNSTVGKQFWGKSRAETDESQL